MKTLLYLLPVCYLLQTANERIDFNFSFPSNSANKSFFRLGDQLITLEKHGHNTMHPYVIVSLHSDEATSVATTINFVKTHDANFIRLVNKNKKNVEANLFDQKVSFDPRNIFTSWGRRINLKLNKCWNKSTIEQVQKFSSFLLDEMPEGRTIVTVHTNSNSISDYLKGGSFEKQAKEIAHNPLLDAADFFLTTDESIFLKLKEKQLNAVLQNEKKAKDDGSLGVYCSKVKRSYVSIEIKAGHIQEQQEMLQTIHDILK